MMDHYQFYTESADAREKLTCLNSIIDVNSPKLQQVVAELPNEKLQQVVAEIPFPASFAYVPWGQHIEIITKCRTIDEALFYIQKTIENGYSRSTLINVIEADFYIRVMGLINGVLYPPINEVYSMSVSFRSAKETSRTINPFLVIKC